MEEIIMCPPVPGSDEFLEYFSGVTKLHLASATPPDDLQIILQERDLQKYFSTVNGSDRPKTEIMKDIADKWEITPGDILYIGDSREDLISAENFGCMFIGRQRAYDFKKAGVVGFQDLSGIKGYILENYIFETA